MRPVVIRHGLWMLSIVTSSPEAKAVLQASFVNSTVMGMSRKAGIRDHTLQAFELAHVRANALRDEKGTSPARNAEASPSDQIARSLELRGSTPPSTQRSAIQGSPGRHFFETSQVRIPGAALEQLVEVWKTLPATDPYREELNVIDEQRVRERYAVLRRSSSCAGRTYRRRIAQMHVRNMCLAITLWTRCAIRHQVRLAQTTPP